jgi:hypothetical protein
LCAFFLLFSPLRLSAMSVVFDFNTSLNDAAPVSIMLLSVDEKTKGKNELLMDVFGVSFFLLYSQLRLSFVSVVLDFSESLNAVAPVSSTLFPVDVKRNGKE